MKMSPKCECASGAASGNKRGDKEKQHKMLAFGGYIYMTYINVYNADVATLTTLSSRIDISNNNKQHGCLAACCLLLAAVAVDFVASQYDAQLFVMETS